jgi:hypothetical protein
MWVENKLRFHNPGDLKLIAPIMLQVLNLPTHPTGTIGKYRSILINRMCRELEKLIKIGKSKRAHGNAQCSDIHGDLSEYSWARKSLLDDKHEEGFHFEHSETVYELEKSLKNLSNPTLEDVESILGRARVTWVTKDENARLDKLGVKSRRPDWRKAYEDAGIELTDDSH